MDNLYEITATAIDGSHRSLADYRGKVLLIVNVASRCGYTPQYGGLEALYQTYKDRGLVVLGFPCNQFGRQEPGTEAEISLFCGSTYAVTFPMFAKIDVNGPNAHPLYKLLKQNKPGFIGTRFIKWNFTKFLITAQGLVARRYAPCRRPEHLEDDIRRILT